MFGTAFPNTRTRINNIFFNPFQPKNHTVHKTAKTFGSFGNNLVNCFGGGIAFAGISAATNPLFGVLACGAGYNRVIKPATEFTANRVSDVIAGVTTLGMNQFAKGDEREFELSDQHDFGFYHIVAKGG